MSHEFQMLTEVYSSAAALLPMTTGDLGEGRPPIGTRRSASPSYGHHEAARLP